MPTIRLRFPGGRYHATPWGHHVNEGLVEWPPCPWRLLRALVASGFCSQQWDDVPSEGKSLIENLASVLPRYLLPSGSLAHSRHYMPTIEGPKQTTTLVFDTWAHIGAGEVLVNWPCQLNDGEERLLERLLRSLGYLGRSESWVEAELVADEGFQWNAMPCDDVDQPGREWEQVSLVAATPPQYYRGWWKNQVEEALAPLPLPEGGQKPPKKLLKEREKAQEPFPPDLLACLMKDTSWWKGHGWSQPPGSRRVLYWRPRDLLQVSSAPSPRRPPATRLSAFLLSLTTPSGITSALPPCARTLPQAELLHRALVSKAARGGRIDCPELIGRDGSREPLQNGHQHAHTIPLDLDGDARLDHILVYAAMGFGPEAQRALRRVRKTWMKGGVGELQVAVAFSGDLETLRQFPGLVPFLGPKEGATVWESSTPFVPPKTMDGRASRSIAAQVQRELVNRGLPEAISIEIIPELTKAFRHYVRERHRGGAPPRNSIGFGLRITFAKSVTGPLLLGYASHYGLGLFRALVS